MANAESQQQQESGPSSPFGEPAVSQAEAARRAVDAMVEAGLFDKVMAQVDTGELRLRRAGSSRRCSNAPWRRACGWS
jgi:hypothetical protein